MRSSLFDVLWFTLAYPAALVLAVAVGYAFAEVFYRRRQRVWKPSGIENALITIFGLLLSFTLLSSNNALKERTTLIHQSADAVADLARAGDLLPPARHAVVQGFLREFLALELDEHRPGRAHDPAHARRLEALYYRAWEQIRAPARADATGAAEAQRLLPAFNALSAATARLHYSYQERTPHGIVVLLLLSSWAIGVLVGFTNSAQETRHFFVPALFVVISVLTVQAIRDLDDPEIGFIRPNYNSLLDLQRLLGPGPRPGPQP